MESQKFLKGLPPALVLDLSATGIAVVRMLSRHGVQVYGADLPGRAVGKYSKYIKEPLFGYELKTRSNFLEDLIAFSKTFSNKPFLTLFL